MSHKNLMLRVFFGLTIVLCLRTPLFADLIGSYNFDHTVLPEHSPFPETNTFKFYYGPYQNGQIIGIGYLPQWGPIIDLEFTAADVGTTFVAPWNDAYKLALESLMNGTLDSCAWMLSSRGSGGPESHFWQNDSDFVTTYYGGTNGIDFEGFIIEQVSWTLNEYASHDIDFTIAVQGRPGQYVPPPVVPVPGALALAGIGAGAVGLFRRRRRA